MEHVTIWILDILAAAVWVAPVLAFGESVAWAAFRCANLVCGLAAEADAIRRTV